jgi:hypothetical protein
MRSSVFQYPYIKVFRRAESVLSNIGMKIISSDAIKGSIKAKTGFSLNKPAIKIDLIIEEMENHDTKITIKGITLRNRFFHKKGNVDQSEADILNALSSIM